MAEQLRMSHPLYVPFVRVLEGDMEGLSHARKSAQGLVLPYFEIVKTRPRKNDRSASFITCAVNFNCEYMESKRPGFRGTF